MDDKELLKRMMLAYVCLEELEIVYNGYFEEKLSRLAYELEATMIEKFSSRPVFDEEMDTLQSRYERNFREFKQRVLGE